MIPGHLLEFTPSAFTHAIKICKGLERVLEVQTYGEKLHVFVDEVSKRKSAIESALTSQGIQFDLMREIEVLMEEAFVSLIRCQKEGSLQNLSGGVL